MDTPILVAVLLLGGLALIFAEVCTPSFGLLAVGAIVCFALGWYFAFTIHTVLGIVVVAASLVGLAAYLPWMMRVFPRTPFGRRLVLTRDNKDTSGGVPEAGNFARLLGAEGTATSTLRPTGTVEIEGQRIIASAESGMIPAGARVRVVRAGGMNVVVRATQEPAPA